MVQALACPVSALQLLRPLMFIALESANLANLLQTPGVPPSAHQALRSHSHTIFVPLPVCLFDR